jgi:uncharacterized membrane protein
MIGFLIVLSGIIVFVAAAILSGGGSADFGIVIFIGPIPIVLGAGPQATLLILFSIMLAALSITIFLLMRKRMEKASV